MRTAGGASGVLVGLSLAELAKQGAPVNTALVASLGAVSFAAEMVGALPMGLLSDALSPRVLMTGGGTVDAPDVWASVFLLGSGGHLRAVLSSAG
jgi:hypothetical protein